MAEAKTRPTGSSVDSFLDAVPDPRRREDAKKVRVLMERLSGAPAAMWGPGIVGFGRYRYRYDSGRTGEFLRIGFSPRARALALYVMGGFPRHEALMERLGRYRTGKSCLYLERLSDVDESVPEALVRASLDHMRARYPEHALPRAGPGSSALHLPEPKRTRRATNRLASCYKCGIPGRTAGEAR